MADHSSLVKVAARWLKQTHRCSIVAAELSSGAGETPDVFGMAFGHITYNIECKVSRSDFKRDARKGCDRVGMFRYYMTTPDLISVDELPPKWGLLETGGKTVSIIREAKPARGSRRCEMNILYSIILRLNGRSPMRSQEQLVIEQPANQEARC